LLLCKAILEAITAIIGPVLQGIAEIAKAAAAITGKIFGPLEDINPPGFDSSSASVAVGGNGGGLNAGSEEFRQVLGDFASTVKDATRDIHQDRSPSGPTNYSNGPRGGAGNTYNFDGLQVNLAPIDTNEATTQIASKIRAPMNNAIAGQKAELAAVYSAQRVLASL
jgi:hypothetical protein